MSAQYEVETIWCVQRVGGSPQDNSILDAALARRAADGWELVDVVAENYAENGDLTRVKAFFRRDG